TWSTACAVAVSNAAGSTALPCSLAMTVSISDFGRGRLPVWVVRMRSVEVFMQGSGMGQALILAFSTRDCRAWARAAVAVAALATLSRVGYSLPMGRPII